MDLFRISTAMQERFSANLELSWLGRCGVGYLMPLTLLADLWHMLTLTLTGLLRGEYVIISSTTAIIELWAGTLRLIKVPRGNHGETWTSILLKNTYIYKTKSTKLDKWLIAACDIYMSCLLSSYGKITQQISQLNGYWLLKESIAAIIRGHFWWFIRFIRLIAVKVWVMTAYMDQLM